MRVAVYFCARRGGDVILSIAQQKIVAPAPLRSALKIYRELKIDHGEFLVLVLRLLIPLDDYEQFVQLPKSTE